MLKIIELRMNHLDNPVGFHIENVNVQWKVTNSIGTDIKWARVIVSEKEDFSNLLYDTGCSEQLSSSGTVLPIKLCCETRYFWKVFVCDNGGEEAESETAFFETAKSEKEWNAQWISPENENDNLVGVSFDVEKKVASARLYVTGLGLFEAYLDGEKIGDEYLTPNFNNYDAWIQFDTYVLQSMAKGKHALQMILGDGWYKGRYLHMGPGPDHCKYGDKLAALAEIHLQYEDGTQEILGTDERWYAGKSNIIRDSIYDGEEINDNCLSAPLGNVLEQTEDKNAVLVRDDLNYDKLTARYSLPVKVMEEVTPIAVLYTPKDEVVLDFGQNMVGWVSFYNRIAKGETVSYQTGEILQDDCFYRENYRSAESKFTYTSDGRGKWVRPHFTFYGFRYLKLEGFGTEINLEDFKAQVLYSQMPVTGQIHTANEKVNQLISNILWGQKGNFLDVPTDCPQRDERLGWTGDAQVFSMTAMYNMDTAVFYRKYMKDVYTEQQKNKGAVPFAAPNICFASNASAAWGDAATIIPWNLYLMYGDKDMLAEQYDGMKAWADYIYSRDILSGDTRLWITDNHFGDWLSMDDPGIGAPVGGTDMDLIATGYYYYSTSLTAKAANVLGRETEAAVYEKRAEEIKHAFQKEFVTEAGRLAVETQTAYAFTLYMGLGLAGKEKKLIDGLVKALKNNKYHLNTGFVGTPFLCQMLSKYGENELAYRLLLNEEFPGWLYCVNLGATTIWERWNSVMPDGHMNPEGMNSLNHYAYGSIAQWMYQYMLGIRPDEEQPGWKHFYLEPMPDTRIQEVEGHYNSCMGQIKSKWFYDEERNIHFEFEIPFGTQASVQLHDVMLTEEEKHMELCAGKYQFVYPAKSMHSKNYSKDTLLSVLLQDDAAKEVLSRFAPDLLFIPPQFATGTIEDSICNVFGGHAKMELAPIVEELRKI